MVRVYERYPSISSHTYDNRPPNHHLLFGGPYMDCLHLVSSYDAEAIRPALHHTVSYASRKKCTKYLQGSEQIGILVRCIGSNHTTIHEHDVSSDQSVYGETVSC